MRERQILASEPTRLAVDLPTDRHLAPDGAVGPGADSCCRSRGSSHSLCQGLTSRPRRQHIESRYGGFEWRRDSNRSSHGSEQILDQFPWRVRELARYDDHSRYRRNVRYRKNVSDWRELRDGAYRTIFTGRARDGTSVSRAYSTPCSSRSSCRSAPGAQEAQTLVALPLTD